MKSDKSPDLEIAQKKQAGEPAHARATIIVPCIEVESLTVRCVEESARFFPKAEIIVLPDVADSEDHLAGKARVVVTGPVTIAKKRNIGAREAQKSLLAFIDSDAYPDPQWLDAAVRTIDENPDAGAAAGPNVSPPDEPYSERIVGIALRSSICAHNADYIKIPATPRLVANMPTCNLTVRKKEYLEMGGMNEQLFGGEDTEFCARLARAGRPIVYRPEILVFHKNRSMQPFIKQRLSYGGFVYKTFLESPNRTVIISLLPALFVIFLLSGVFIPLIPLWKWVYVLALAFYGGVLIFEVCRHGSGLADRAGGFFAMMVATLCPGIGAIATVFGLLPDFRKIYRNDQ
jgi:GT2 family glycosyltransferase